MIKGIQCIALVLGVAFSASVWMGYHERNVLESDWRHAKWTVVQDSLHILELSQPTIGINVVVTIYHPVPEQTDSTPDIVASGKRINIRRAGEYRYIAVSRDLLVRWGGPLRYGDHVRIDNAGELSGWYQVEDTMNARWTNRVDILRSPGAPLAKFDQAILMMDKP